MTTPTLTLTDFLLARIAEDEASHQVEQVPIPPATNPDGSWKTVPGRPRPGDARVLAECAAKRRIVRRAMAAEDALGDEMEDSTYFIRRASRDSWNLALADLALPYADHPDYREEWKP